MNKCFICGEGTSLEEAVDYGRSYWKDGDQVEWDEAEPTLTFCSLDCEEVFWDAIHEKSFLEALKKEISG